MNSSAKLTAISFLAASALGAIILTACTVTSGTVDDTDGGSQEDKDSGTGTTSDSGNTTTDSGDTDAGTATCESKKRADLELISTSAACQTCLAAKCCTQIQTCFAIPEDTANGKTECNAYSDCIRNCVEDPENDTQEKLEACFTDICDGTAAEGVPAAYINIEQCGNTSCNTECSTQ